MDQWECWNCTSANLEAGGFDREGNPITVCAACGVRQESE